jgi:thioredoxin 2
MSSVSFNCQKCKTTNRISGVDVESSAKCQKCQSALLEGNVIELLPHNFQALAMSKKPLLIFMSGPNCSKCKIFAPIFEDVCTQLKKQSNVWFAQAYLPKNKPLMSKYKIRGVPTLVLVHKGKLQQIVHGGLRKNELLQFIKKHTH